MMFRSSSTAGAVLVATLFGSVAALGLFAAPVAAHEGKAIIEVEAAHPASESVHYVVRVTWEDDGHAAVDATVTATAVAADGASETPVTLAPADSDGRYEGVVEFSEPGDWTVRFTSIDPNGSIEQSEQIAAPSTTTTAASTEDSAAPAPGSDDAASDSAAPSSSDDSDIPVWLIVAAGIVAVVGVVTALGIVRRHRTPPEPDAS